MAALIKPRNTPERELLHVVHPLEAGAVIHAGSLFALNAAGNAVPGSTATGLKAVGRAEDTIDNSGGAAGDVFIKGKKGTFGYENDGTVNRTHIEGTAYIVDDQTVSASSNGGTRSIAGKIIDLDASIVWVKFD